MRKVVTVTKNGNRPAVIIPQTIARTLGLKPGSTLVMTVDRGFLILTSIDHEIDRLQKRSSDAVTAAELAPVA